MISMRLPRTTTVARRAGLGLPSAVSAATRAGPSRVSCSMAALRWATTWRRSSCPGAGRPARSAVAGSSRRARRSGRRPRRPRPGSSTAAGATAAGRRSTARRPATRAVLRRRVPAPPVRPAGSRAGSSGPRVGRVQAGRGARTGGGPARPAGRVVARRRGALRPAGGLLHPAGLIVGGQPRLGRRGSAAGSGTVGTGVDTGLRAGEPVGGVRVGPRLGEPGSRAATPPRPVPPRCRRRADRAAASGAAARPRPPA